MEGVLASPIGADKSRADIAPDKWYVGFSSTDIIILFPPRDCVQKGRAFLEVRILISSFSSSRLSTRVIAQLNYDNGGFHRR